MSIAAIVVGALSNRYAQSRPFIKNQEFGVSVIGGFLVAGNQRTTVAAPKEIYKKNIVHPFCYLFRKQERETHEAVDRALHVGIKSGQDRISG